MNTYLLIDQRKTPSRASFTATFRRGLIFIFLIKCTILLANPSSELGLSPDKLNINLSSEADYLSKELQKAIRKAKSEYSISILKNENSDLEKKTLVLISVNEMEDQDQDVLTDLKNKIEFFNHLKAHADLKWRTIQFALKSTAALLLFYHTYRWIHFDAYQMEKTREYILAREAQEKDPTLGNPVLDALNHEQDFILGSFIFSTYIATGHFLKPFLGKNPYFERLFFTEGFSIQSETDNLVEQIKDIQVREKESDSFLFEIQSLYFKDVVTSLENQGYRKIELPKFSNL